MKQYTISVLTTFAIFCLLTMAPLAPAPTLAAEEPTASMARAHGDGQPGQVDINSASLEELRTLPGIGRAYSKKIVEHRPYKSVEELQTRKVLPQGTYMKLRDKIVANGR